MLALALVLAVGCSNAPPGSGRPATPSVDPRDDPDAGPSSCNGAACAPGQTCQGGRCTPSLCGAGCRFGLSCDPVAQQCLCAGVACADTQVCAEGRCVAADRCGYVFGVECGVSGSCSRGNCVCGGAEACREGHLCIDQACLVDKCPGVNCDGGTRCDPEDGLCHCVPCGAGPHRDPICVPPERCVQGDCTTGYPAGHPCCGVHCDPVFPGSTCDEEDGFCKCGGLGGERCAVTDICEGRGPGCTSRCDPLAPSCAACYLDAALGLGACLDPGTAAEGSPCTAPGDCAVGLACLPLGQPSSCFHLCPASSSGACPAGELCAPMDRYPGLGACLRAP